MSTPTARPSHGRLMELAEIIGIDIPPAEGDPRTCSHAWGFALSPDLVQDWLLDALQDVNVTAPEVPGEPNAFRVDGYLDWKSLAKAQPEELSIMDEWVPTSLSLDIVEELRAAGHHASMTAYAFVSGQAGHHLTFGIEATFISVSGSSAGAVLAPFEDRIRAGIDAIPIPDGQEPAGLTLYEWEDSAEWSFG